MCDSEMCSWSDELQRPQHHVLFVSHALRGHLTQLIATAMELQTRGYKVSFVTEPRGMSGFEETKLRFIPWGDASYQSRFEPAVQQIFKRAGEAQTALESHKILLESVQFLLGESYSFLKHIVATEKPDLIVCDRTAFSAIELAINENIPLVIMSRFLIDRIPTALHFPAYASDYPAVMSFSERLHNFFLPFRMASYLVSLGVISNLIRFRKANRIKTFPLDLSVNANIPTIIGNYWGLEFPRWIPSTVNLVGPILPPKDSWPPLAADVEQFLESPTRPVLYISLGTIAWSPFETIQKIIQALGQCSDKFMVLWSLPDSQTYGLEFPASFKRVAFTSQLRVLQHPKVFAFFSHGGMNSVSESIYFGKPLLVLPFFGDQFYWSARVQDRQLGLSLSKNFSVSELQSKVLQLMQEGTVFDILTL